LLVDPSDECREVLRTLLELRGVRTWEASGAREGLELLRRHGPDVVILDADSESADDEDIRREYGRQTDHRDAAIVFLGTINCAQTAHRNELTLAKPYHYAPLIRTIEELLVRSRGVSQPALTPAQLS
jgi:CheY-like chemotaxis protein